ncbi:MAG TPA: gluconokinase [Candidatus Acidoferrum sp.]|nr:gluconokinase [Candidatus Acidoferrum sp.]
MPHPQAARGAIIVMGVSGAGKTTLAALLAEALGCPFIEGDALHSAANVAKMAAGQPLTDADRWPWLDNVAAALRDAIATHRVATAACSALRQVYRDRLRTTIGQPTFFILLEAQRAELEQRLAQRSGHYMPATLLDSQLATLEPPHDASHTLVLDARLSPTQLREAAIQWLTASTHTTSGG